MAAELPLQVICEMVGVPLDERQQVFDLSNRLLGFDDPDFGTADPQDRMKVGAEILGIALRMAEKYRDAPPETNLTTVLMNAEVDGERLSPIEFGVLFMVLLVAGNETTRTVTVNGFRTLLANPEQYERLTNDLTLIPAFVEEALRYEPAVIHFRRTATRDTEIRGKKIREGDKLILWYPSANRDEEVFDDPNRFDIGRSPNHHISFGLGEHFCLGSHLARLELRGIFREILTRLKDPKLVGEPRRLRSNFINGVKEMHVEFRGS